MTAATQVPRSRPARPDPVRRRGRRRVSGLTVVRYLAAVVVVAVTLVPLLYVAIGGFRTNAQINASPTGFPHPWVLGNYARILKSGLFWHFLLNSTVIAVIVTTLAVVCGAMAAYGLSRYYFAGRGAIFAMFTVGLLFPLGVATLPVYLLLRHLNLLESWWGVALPEAAFALPATVVILRPFMAAIPDELDDAAAIDGAGKLAFFARILLPLSRPALVTAGALAFIGSWNGYLLPLLVFNNEPDFTLPLGVATFQSQYAQDTASILAFTALSMVPALVFFVLAERQIVGGLTGSVKG